MSKKFDKENLNVPKLSILGQDNSHYFHENHLVDRSSKLPKKLARHRGFSRVFKKNELTFSLIAPFKGYPDTPIPDVADLGDIAQSAEKYGFEALWVRDVPFFDPDFGDVGQGLDPMVALGYLAAKTETIALGSAGIISTLREPIHIAKAAASMSVLTDNRFILGLSSGDRPIEYDAFQVGYERRAKRFRESWKKIKVLTEKEVDFPQFRGNYYGDLTGEIDFVPKINQRVPLVAIGRARQSIDWLANRADAWIWHGVDPKDTQNIVETLAEKSRNGKWHPFGYQNFVELLENPNAPVRLYNNIYLRGGSKAMADFWYEQKERGLSHVAINLKPTHRPNNEVLQDISENILSVFKD